MRTTNILSLVGAGLLGACASAPDAPPATSAPDNAMNPFLEAEWSTPFGSPPFDRITAEHYGPAFDEGMKLHAAQIAAIATNPEAPTFANTMVALERAGQVLDRVSRVFFNQTGSMASDRLQEIKLEYAPKLTVHEGEIYTNPALFDRVDTLFKNREALGLTPEQRLLLRDYHRAFVRQGASLDEPGKKRLVALNARLAELYTEFSEKIRLENAEFAMVVETQQELEGLPAPAIAMAADIATKKGHPGKWAFTLVRASINPFLTYAKNRELRQKLYTAYVSRGANNDERDTRAQIREILELRAERAALLGFANHAHYAIDANMAKTPEAVSTLLDQLWAGSRVQMTRERDDLQALIAADLGAGAKLQPWDWRYYSERLRKERYDVSDEELKPYFEVNAVRQGAFDTASALFGVSFEEVTERVSVYHPEVKVFEVKNSDGSHVGLLYVDYFPRDSKRGGAWMSALRVQRNLDGAVRPLICNVGNFPPPTGDEPALLGWDEVTTLFHEFGHALHGLLSNVTYPSAAGTSVKRDYVEFPSQVFENWAAEPVVMKKYARHYKTGEPIPDALIDKLQKARTFNQGFATGEVVAAALLDMAWHTQDAAGIATAFEAENPIQTFDQKVAASLELIPEVAPRYHSPYFQHIFAGGSYAAGYYVYLWAQVLEADAFAAFQESGDPLNPELGKKLRELVFAAGGSAEEMVNYEAFRGRAPEVKALFDKLGFAAPPVGAE